MKPKFLLPITLSAALAAQSISIFAADPPPAPAAASADAKAAAHGPKEDLTSLVSKIKTKLQAGKTAAGDFTDELKEFDGLIEKYKGQKSEEVAQIVMMKAMLYVEIFDQPEQGIVLAKRLKTDFPDTALGKGADELIEQIQSSVAAHEIDKQLAVGKPFPDFDEKDLDGKALSIGSFKGKVLLVDFWATWCGPCVGELPNVLQTYEKLHGKGFEIVGISLDKDQEALTSFIKDKKVSWRQYFDGKGWQNKLATKYGIRSIPATFLLDGKGIIIGKNLRGEALGEAVTKALAPN